MREYTKAEVITIDRVELLKTFFLQYVSEEDLERALHSFDVKIIGPEVIKLGNSTIRMTLYSESESQVCK